MDLSALHNAVDRLEQAVAGVAEKVATAATSTIEGVSQDEVDQLVHRVESQAERLTGLQAPATTTHPADTAAASTTAAPAWTPDHPAA